jgi:xanthine dehydrogenase accessory factor
MFEQRIVVRGGGDLGTGVAIRMWRCGFPVIIFECRAPAAVRRTVAFGEAIYEGRQCVEGVVAELVTTAADAQEALERDVVPVISDPEAVLLPSLEPYAVVDAIVAKRNTGTRRNMARLVVGLGPGFCAPDDVHAVIETNRGPDLGRTIWFGRAELDTGEPGAVRGVSGDRVLRAPVTGILQLHSEIGAIIRAGDVLASVEGHLVTAPFAGLIRGLAHEGLKVGIGTKIGDVDPRPDPTLCARISDKALAVAGGVLEAVLVSLCGKRL